MLDVLHVTHPAITCAITWTSQVDMQDVEEVYKAADADNSGTIDSEEFKIALSSWKQEMAEVNWQQLAKDIENARPAAKKSSMCALM